MNRRLDKPILTVLAVVFIMAASAGVFAATSQPQSQFNSTTPQNLFLNWTTSPQFQSNITLRMNTSQSNFTTLVLEIVNQSSFFTANYSQPMAHLSSLCNPPSFRVQLTNGTYFAVTETLSTASPETNVSLNFSLLNCQPGRYVASNLTVRNSTQTSESLNFSVFLDVPIVSDNTLSRSTGIGSFNGSLSANTTQYQSYYFYISNGSTVENATGVTLNLTGLNATNDVDLFLFTENGTLAAKSIDSATTSESAHFNYLPSTSRVWEIRVYGNINSSVSSSYGGSLIFTTLNVTNTSSPSLRAQSLRFGSSNASAIATANYTLQNGGVNFSLDSMAESKELFYVKRINGNAPGNLSVFIPDSSIVSRIKIGMNWTGGANYSVKLYNPDGVLIGTSSNKQLIANVTNATQEVLIDTTSVSSVAGLWRMDVSNQALVNNDYNISVFMGVSASNWISTNFSTTSLSAYGSSGSNQSVSMTLTVQNNSLDGVYEGAVRYSDSRGSVFSMPVKIDVTSPVLLVNSTANLSTVTLTENNGTVGNRSIDFLINNTGSVDMFLVASNSSDVLSCNTPSTCGSSTVSMSYNTTSLISASGSVGIHTSVAFDNTAPRGLYVGWIFFNSTNNTFQLSGRPYSTFNLTVRLNLTGEVQVGVINVQDSSSGSYGILGDTSAIERNFTVKVILLFANGSIVPGNNSMNTTHFSGVLQNGNVTGAEGRAPSSGSLQIFNGTNPIMDSTNSSIYNLIFTLPNSTSGGAYSLLVTYSGNNIQIPGTFTGTGSNRSVQVNNTGLFLSTNTSSITLSTGVTSSKAYLNVTNFGVAPGAALQINFNDSCSAWTSTTNTSSSSCAAWSPAATNASTFTVTPTAFSSCILSWDVTNTSPNTTSACPGTMRASRSDYDFNQVTVSVDVTGQSSSSSSSDSSSSSSSSSSSDSASTAATTTAAAADSVYLQITKWTSIVEAVQGSSGTTSVIVKNTEEDGSQTISLKAIDLPSEVSVSVSPESKVINGGNSGEFVVTFAVPEGLAVKDYPGKFQASNSDSSIEKDFTLRVLPGEAAKAKISSDFANFTSELELLFKEINATRSSGGNVNATEEFAVQIKDKLAEAQAQIALGTDDGYFAASQILEEVARLLDTAKSQLKVDKKTAGFAWPVDPLYIGVGVGVAAIGFLVYLFLPSKGGSGIKIGKQMGKAADAAGAVKDAAGSAAGKVTDAAGNMKDATADQFKKLQEKFRLKKEFKYKYEE